MYRTMAKLIFIEEGIGAGKSSLIEKLKKTSNLNANYIPETDFTKFNKWNMLEKFYKDPEKNSFTFQIFVMAIQMLEIKKSIKNHPNVAVHIAERSPGAGFHCFGKKILKNNQMELDILSLLHEATYEIIPKPNGILYLDITPEKSLQRIKLRGNPEEQIIPLEYLKDLEKYQKIWCHNNFPPYSPHHSMKIVSDNNKNLETIYKEALFFIEKIVHEESLMMMDID